MADPKQYASLVLTGLAELLQASGIGTHRADGSPYPDSELPITLGRLHPKSATAIALTDYLDLPGATRASRLYVQARIRSEQFVTGRDLVDSIRDALHRRTHADLRGIRVGEVWLDSFIPLGPDGNGRFEWTQNYRLTGLRALPTAQPSTPPAEGDTP